MSVAKTLPGAGTELAFGVRRCSVWSNTCSRLPRGWSPGEAVKKSRFPDDRQHLRTAHHCHAFPVPTVRRDTRAGELCHAFHPRMHITRSRLRYNFCHAFPVPRRAATTRAGELSHAFRPRMHVTRSRLRYNFCHAFRVPDGAPRRCGRGSMSRLPPRMHITRSHAFDFRRMVSVTPSMQFMSRLPIYLLL
jgi:hypothetical protein